MKRKTQILSVSGALRRIFEPKWEKVQGAERSCIVRTFIISATR
jgi:hypothetical protein